MQCKRPRFDPRVGKIPWRREWQPTPVFLHGKFHGQRSLAGYSPWGRKESDTTEQLSLTYLCYAAAAAKSLQSCPTLCDPIDSSPSGSPSLGFSRQEHWSGLPCPPPEDLPNPGIKLWSPALQVDSLLSEPPGKPKNTGVGSLSFLQGNLPNPGIEPGSPPLPADSLLSAPPGKPRNIGVGSLSLL